MINVCEKSLSENHCISLIKARVDISAKLLEYMSVTTPRGPLDT